MTITGSILRLAGTTLLVVAVAGCGGLGRLSGAPSGDPGTDPAAGTVPPSLGGDLTTDGATTDDALADELDALLDEMDAGFDDLDPSIDEPGASPAPSAGASAGGAGTVSGGSGSGQGGPSPAPLPAFDPGSFADLDAALSALEASLSAGAAGSEGNLP